MAKILGVAQKIAIIDDKFKQQEEDLRSLDKVTSDLRDSIHDLALRVHTLEEGRKVTEADTKRVIGEFLNEASLRFKDAEISALKKQLESKEAQ